VFPTDAAYCAADDGGGWKPFGCDRLRTLLVMGQTRHWSGSGRRRRLAPHCDGARVGCSTKGSDCTPATAPIHT
jgi:hypothetical protein